jgi:hypothetical protein
VQVLQVSQAKGGKGLGEKCPTHAKHWMKALRGEALRAQPPGSNSHHVKALGVEILEEVGMDIKGSSHNSWYNPDTGKSRKTILKTASLCGGISTRYVPNTKLKYTLLDRDVLRRLGKMAVPQELSYVHHILYIAYTYNI